MEEGGSWKRGRRWRSSWKGAAPETGSTRATRPPVKVAELPSWPSWKVGQRWAGTARAISGAGTRHLATTWHPHPRSAVISTEPSVSCECFSNPLFLFSCVSSVIYSISSSIQQQFKHPIFGWVEQLFIYWLIDFFWKWSVCHFFFDLYREREYTKKKHTHKLFSEWHFFFGKKSKFKKNNFDIYKFKNIVIKQYHWLKIYIRLLCTFIHSYSKRDYFGGCPWPMVPTPRYTLCPMQLFCF